ncbi:DUF3263 domain-containing protein [Streptomyces sp. NBC_01433]|uniref:DUF3263 domain-containing protein n=1 Tax=Streptomyces sp. NBC_01433 TaxID=2903864 RepID=UPI0022588620|nr:DUF3263 domain-containing protein [Streptomyces sp. NBC_01433]MCX4682345.1 DUF3263 domain-containing protein [Streptomyces sp. NBC_01433]
MSKSQSPLESVGGQSLTEQERQILDAQARLAALPAGPRERLIREQLGMSPTRYFQTLNALLDSVQALEYAPVTINRLRRAREDSRRKYW